MVVVVEGAAAGAVRQAAWCGSVGRRRASWWSAASRPTPPPVAGGLVVAGSHGWLETACAAWQGGHIAA